MKNFLCFIGSHKWREIYRGGYGQIVQKSQGTESVIHSRFKQMQCERCGREKRLMETMK